MLGPDGKPEQRKVTTGLDNKIVVEITSGLHPGDMVVVKAASFVRPGDRITPVPLAAN